MVAITMGAKCWDGERRQSIDARQIISNVLEIGEQAAKSSKWKEAVRRLNDPKIKAIAGYTIPIALLASGLPPLGLGRALAASFPVGGKVFFGDPNAPAPIVTKGLPPGTIITPPDGTSFAITQSGAISAIPTPVVVADPIEAGASIISPDVIAAAGVGQSIKNTILHAFDPLIELIVTLSVPIAGIMIAGGCLFIMVGNREKGMSMLQNAAIGYILVQLSPMLLRLLVGIGGSL